MELPFQWDDGNFLSPFVASSEENLAAVSHWLLQHVLLPALHEHLRARAGAPASAEEPTVTLHFRLADLGCGEGSALFFISQHLADTWQERVDAALAAGSLSSSESDTERRLQHLLTRTQLSMTVLGVDLEDVLVDQAEATSKVRPADPAAVTTTYRFICEDIRHCSLDELFPPVSCAHPEPAASDASQPACAVVRAHLYAQSALYLYLLPEGLEVMRAQVMDIAGPRGWLVLSNRWPIPFLQPISQVTAVASVNIYQCEREKTASSTEKSE